MKKTTVVILVTVFVVGLMLAQKLFEVTFLLESFGSTSPGTLVQLASSHVATAEDLEEWREEQRQIKRELIELTGSP